jgi:hypothetical protein
MEEETAHIPRQSLNIMQAVAVVAEIMAVVWTYVANGV